MERKSNPFLSLFYRSQKEGETKKGSLSGEQNLGEGNMT